MITYEDALTANEFWNMSLVNADGTPTRCRRNGATQTWKREPGKFRIPVKYGLREYFYIINFDGDLAHNRNNHEWCTPQKWEVEHVLFEGITPGNTTVSSPQNP